MSPSSYQVLQLVDSQVEKFRTRKPAGASLVLARQHYEEAGQVEASGPYEAWALLRNGDVELPREFGVGDVLETEDSAPLVCNYWGIESANWKDQSNRWEKLKNPFSVVCYLEGDLAQLVAEIRRELNGCDVKPHLTILPPRELSVAPEAAVAEFQRLVEMYDKPFHVKVGSITTFERTKVIKFDLSSADDADRVAKLHDHMSSELFQKAEAYQYDPHITLSMEADTQRTEEFLKMARGRWSSFNGSRTIAVDRLSLVRQADDDSWGDLAQARVGASAAALA